MAYSKFTLESAKKELDLTAEMAVLFPIADRFEAPRWLRDILDRGMELALLSEKARSEFIVAPILLALREHFNSAFAIYSGEPLDVDESRGLNGDCDFILTATKPIPTLVEAPFIVILEAKRGIIEQGIGQCAAQMYAARLRNERDNWPAISPYGCVTSGRDWQFLKLEGTKLLIDRTQYVLNNLDELLGVFSTLLRSILPQRIAA